MPDMLVKLYDLPDPGPLYNQLKEKGIIIKRAISPEMHKIVDWVKKYFHSGWASECEVCFSNKPVSCFIAVKNNKILGFACYESSSRNFFGPTGVDKRKRGLGIGKALLLRSLYAMKEEGYAYAIIGGVGPSQFYAKTANAVLIEGSVPGIYRNMVE
ncbi:MAG: GNAT family N-acetyltransferase [Spirochaetales bacterium]|nr:GNAT family N-acetyltransferase [Spirochaetales bacterium]